MENTSKNRYLAYVLRLWRVDGETPAWRASLVDARTGERYGFGSLAALFQFITERVDRGSGAAGHDGSVLLLHEHHEPAGGEHHV